MPAQRIGERIPLDAAAQLFLGDGQVVDVGGDGVDADDGAVLVGYRERSWCASSASH